MRTQFCSPARALRLALQLLAVMSAAWMTHAAHADECDPQLGPYPRYAVRLPWDSPPMHPRAPRDDRPPMKMLPISGGAMKITTTIGGVTFDSNYDNGSLYTVTSGGTNIFNLGLFTEDNIDGLGTAKYHFRFKMTGVAGKTLTFNIDHTQSPYPAISIDGGVTWRRMTTTEAPNTSQMVLTFAPGQNTAEIAFFEPVGVGEMYSRINDMVLRPGSNATTSVLGNSFQGRQQWLVRVTDPSVADTLKKSVWVHSRAHAGEVTAAHSVIGFVDAITTNTALGQHLRRWCIFYVVPIHNVDGVFLGCTRWDSQGIDPERQWPTPSRIPEVANIKARVDAIMASANPLKVCLNLHSTQGSYSDSFFFRHMTPSVTSTYSSLQQNYIDALNAATTLFNNAAPGSSQLSPTLFIESYMYNNWLGAVMAITHEGHYRWRTGSTTVPVTGENYREVGRSMAAALVSHLGLPAVGSAVADWEMY